MLGIQGAPGHGGPIKAGFISGVRDLLRVLEEKGHLSHKQDGPRCVFVPTLPRDKARENALKHLVNTFFDGSTEKVVAALLGLSEKNYPRTITNGCPNSLKRPAKKEGRHGNPI